MSFGHRTARLTTRAALAAGLGACVAGLAAGLLACPASAQRPSASITMSADRTQIEPGGIFQLRVDATIRGGGQASIELPDLSAFDVVSRQVSRRTIGMGLGGESGLTQVLHLRARQPGTVTIGPATADLGGRRVASDPLTIQVGDGAPEPQPTVTQPPESGARGDGMAFDPRGFLRTWVDHSDPYVGQQVTVTVYLYLPGPLRGSPSITQEPSTDGFWTRDLLPPSRGLVAETQRLNNRDFQVYVLRRFAAFPLQAGDLTIGATGISIQQGGIFSLFGGGGPESLSATGVPVTVRVRELPSAGRPPGEVHVGSLELHAELDRTQVGTGDAVTLTVTATGRGAVEQVRVPTPSAEGLRVLEPEIRDVTSSPNDVVGGTRTYRWLIVPERPGDTTLGPFEVPVFDPVAERYSVARAAALTLTAAGNGASPAEAEPSEVQPRSDDAAAPSFGPIHPRSELRRSQAAIADQPWLFWLLGLGPLAYVCALGVRSARRRAARHDPSRDARRARKGAKKRLDAAAQHAKANAPREFYAAVATALKEVTEARLGQPVGSLTHPALRRTLQERGMDAELADRIVDELEGCDFARFSAVGVRGDEMDRCLERSRELLSALDRFTPSPVEPA